MSKIYVRWIRAGRMTVPEVPARWRAEVEVLMAEDAGGEAVV